MSLDYLALPIVLYFGGRAAFADFRTGRIPNRTVLWLALGGLLCSGLIALAWALGVGPAQALETLGLAAWALHYTTNALLSFGASFVLWWFGVWAAGDAKLFSALALALPLGFYSRDYHPFFPSFVLFFNTFIGILAWLLGEFAVRLGVQVVRERLYRRVGELAGFVRRKVAENWWQYLKYFVLFVFLFTVIRVVRHLLRDVIEDIVVINKTLLYGVLFVLLYPLMRRLRGTLAFVIALVGLAGYVVWAAFFTDDPSHLLALAQVGWLSLGFVGAYAIYRAYTNQVDRRALSVRDLVPGMILAPSFVEALIQLPGFEREALGHLGPDGLKAEQVQWLRQWMSTNRPDGDFARVEVSTTIPFAPGMLLGVVLTVWLHGYLFYL